MEEKETIEPKKRNILLLITQILATVLVLLFGFALVPKIIGEYIGYFNGESLHDAGWEGLVMELTFYVFLAGYIFTWWKKCTGGAIIILASIIQMAPFLIIDGNLGSLIFGIPLIIVGFLYVSNCKAFSSSS